MNPISCLFELIQLSGCDYCVYELGRKITPISKEQFVQIEQTKQPYPYPINQMAKFALVYWPIGASNNPYIWFLNLPLDEQSLLNTGARNHFVSIIQEVLGNSLTEQNQNQLPDNPYIVLPDQKKLAVLHSLLNQKFNQPMISNLQVSSGLQAVQDYLEQDNLSDWQHLSIQGWADFIVQLKHPSYAKLFNNAFDNIPEQVLAEIAGLIEHSSINRALTQKIISQLNQQSDFADPKYQTLLRILSAGEPELIQTWFTTLLTSKTLDESSLTIIAARFWNYLQDPLLLTQFIQLLNSTIMENAVFKALFSDLAAIPSLRRTLLTLIQYDPSLDIVKQRLSMLYRQPTIH